VSYTARFPTEHIQKEFLKGLSALSKDTQSQIWEALRGLEKDPRPFGRKIFKQLRPPVYLYTYAASYRFRVGEYRILYDVDDKARIVWVFALRRRNEKTYS
jgi:mRNA-degrading endonuclease RelE of RelBE toxin-antitoxin system